MNDDNLIEIAKRAAELNKQAGLTTEDAFELVMEGIRRIPINLQMMVDSIVAIQKDFPMPKEGWEAFVRDLEYTNEKHGFNLVIKPELLNGPSAYEIYAKSINKAIEELSDEEKRQALLNSIIDSEI
jgi:hypothetical protein